MTTNWFALLMILFAPVVFAGCTAPAPADDASNEVFMVAPVKFEPKVLTVEVGTTVTWVQKDTVPHTVTSDEEGLFDSGMMKAMGEKFTFTFTEPGTYTYHCIPHSGKGADGTYSGMTGTIIVTGDAMMDDGAMEEGSMDNESGTASSGNSTASNTTAGNSTTGNGTASNATQA